MTHSAHCLLQDKLSSKMLPKLTDFPAVSKKLTPLTRGWKQLKTIHWCHTAKDYKTKPVF